MATILAFAPKGAVERRTGARTEPAIIIFPGVRYERTAERWEEASAAAAAEPKPRSS